MNRSTPRRVPALLACAVAAALTAGSLAPPAGAAPAPAPHPAPAPAPDAAPHPASYAARQAEQQARPRALFFGDSYVIGGPYAGPGRTMAALAAKRLGWRSVLRGGGGTGFATGNPEYGLGTFLDQIGAGALDVGPVDWLVVEGGSNDRLLPPATIRRAIVRTLRVAAAQHPEARVVLVGTFDPTVDDFSDFDGVTRALRSAARKTAVPYVDGQRWLEGRPDLIGPDYDHPTRAGNVLLGKLLARGIRQVS